MKRVIILRHGEEPKSKKYDQSTIGLNDQGAARTLLMPEIVEKILKADYECHTYTHNVKGTPTSRSYYTCQLLKNKVTVYDDSDEIDKLVNNIKKSANNNIVIVWKHKLIPDIINKLTANDKKSNGLKKIINKLKKKEKKIDYDEIASNINKNLKNYDLLGTKKINVNELTQIKYCSDNVLQNNQKVRKEYIKNDDDIEYSLVWDINLESKTYKVYPGYLVLHENDNSYLVKQYV